VFFALSGFGRRALRLLLLELCALELNVALLELLKGDDDPDGG
jgi:hypothetical protein